MDPVAVSVAEAARLLSISESHVRDLVHDGLIARVPHVGRRIVIAVTELERFANETSAA